MSSRNEHAINPVEESVPMVSGELAVGEDLEFQRKWWRFERIVWLIFLGILICDVLGLFGRGWLANKRLTTSDGILTLQYERIERASTPSLMTLDFGPRALHNGKIELYVSDSLIKNLGTQRIAPEPAVSTLGDGGITYIVPATRAPALMQIEMEPSHPGLHHFRIQAEGSDPIDASIFVVP